MEEKTYRYAEMEPEQLEKLRQAERELERLAERKIVLVAYEKERAGR